MTSLRFVRICTKPFEQRSTTKVELNKRGNLKRPDRRQNQNTRSVPDAQSGKPACQNARLRLNFPQTRLMKPEQELLYGNNIKGGAYDKLTQFGLRPVELMELFPMLGPYFRWFEIEDATTRRALLARGAISKVYR